MLCTEASLDVSVRFTGCGHIGMSVEPNARLDICMSTCTLMQKGWTWHGREKCQKVRCLIRSAFTMHTNHHDTSGRNYFVAVQGKLYTVLQAMLRAPTSMNVASSDLST